jgi:CTP synthase (UTP-ammonia lyase)
MATDEKKFPNFIGDLKSSNIASNITSLNFCSDQIGLLLEQLITPENNAIVATNLDNAKKTVAKTINSNSIELSDDYLKFGDVFKSILSDLKKSPDNLKHLKKIAIHYLDVAKLTKDDRIKNLAFKIADELSE